MEKKMFKRFILILSVLGALSGVSCTKDGVDPDLIAFTVSPEAASADVVTKAAVVNSSNLSSFYVACTTGSVGVSETGVWSASFSGNGSAFTGGKYWPANDAGYHFFAANRPVSVASTGCTVSVPDNNTDVVVAYLPNPVYRQSNELVFNHVFARLGEVVVTPKDGYVLSGVSIRLTPHIGGTYHFRNGNGKNDGSGWSALVDGTPEEVASTTGGTKSNDLYLVPGLYDLTAEWTATKGASSQTFKDKVRTVALLGGQVNRLRTTLGGNAEDLQFIVEVAPWSDNPVNVQF